MWNDPIVEETRRLRDEYAAKHGYNIHAMVEDLQQWEQQGFPLAENSTEEIRPIIVSAPGITVELQAHGKCSNSA